MTLAQPPITGLILAGGLGRRMGGHDKGLVTYQGKPLIEHVLPCLRPQVDSIIISANRNLAVYQQYQYPVVTDRSGTFAGPLAGLEAGLAYCQAQQLSEWLFCVPCDALSLADPLVEHLWQALSHSQTAHSIAIAHDGQRLQPLYALLHLHCLTDLSAYLHANQRKVMQWMQHQQALIVDCSDYADTFRNLNTLPSSS
ncbi:MAG: molybdenum cofactor guanylyltransferase MobA [bacterium]